MKYNPSYPKPPFAIIFGGSDYHLPNNQFSYVINQTEPDFIAYKTTLNQSTSQFGFPLMYFFGPSDPPNQPSGYPYSSLLIGTEDVSTTILLTHPDTVPDLFYIDAADYNYKSYFFYPVYNQEICLGDQFEVNGEVVVSSGLYLDSLTTTLGTDSLVGRKITVQPFLYSDTVSATVCATDGFEFFGANYNQTGFYNVVKGANCDSAHFLDLESIAIPNLISADQNNILTYSTPNPDYSYQWIDVLTGLAVSGATSPSFSPTNNSSYALEITFNGCTVTSNAILTNIGLEDLEDDITCTPNPFKNNINLSFGESPESGSIRLYDLNAKLVYEQVFEYQNEVLVTTSSLPKGIYIIKIKTAEALYQKKMVK